MAKVSELKAGQGKVDVEAVIKSKAEPRVFNKYGKDLKVANAVVSDETGEISLSLWNDDIDKVNVGDKIKITNGYVSEFNGQKQLTSGKFGKMEIISSASDSSSDSSSSSEKVAKETSELDESDIKSEESEQSSVKAKGKRATKKNKELKEESSEESKEESKGMDEELAF